MARVVIGKVSEIPPGNRKIVIPFRGRAGIGVFNVAGSFYAIRNICPHRQGPVCTGELTGRILDSAPPSLESDPPTVEGEGRTPPLSLAHVAIRDLDRALPARSGRSRETYPVKIEGDDIIVEYDE